MARAAFILFAFLCLLAGIFSARVERGGELLGRWEGELTTAYGREKVVLTLLHDGRGHAGSLELPQRTLQLADISVLGDSIQIRLSEGATVRAVVAAEEMVGALQTEDATQAISLNRVSEESPRKRWSIKPTHLLRKLGNVQNLFERRRTSSPAAGFLPI